MSYWDKYRNSHEPTEHWEIRKKFLEAHQKSYDEDRLLCLAQTFYNIEFLGCRYPIKVMKEIEELSQGIADKHREAKKSKVQRTFVAASEAAESKVCRTGMKRKAEDDKKDSSGTVQGQTIHDVMRNQRRPTPQSTVSGLDLRLIQKYLDREPPLSHLILLRMKTETDLNFEYLQRSAKISQVKAQFQFNRADGQIEGVLQIVTICKPFEVLPVVKTVMINPMNTISKSKKRTIKEKLMELASPLLHRKHFCVVVNNQFYSSQNMVERDEDKAEKEKVEELIKENRGGKALEKIEGDDKKRVKRENKNKTEDVNVEKAIENVKETRDNIKKDKTVMKGDISKDIKLEDNKKGVKETKDNVKDLEDVRDKRYANFKHQLASINTKQRFDEQNTRPPKKYVSDDYEKLAENNIEDIYGSAQLVHLLEPGAFPLSKPKTKELRDKLIALADPILKENHLCVVMDARFYSSRDMVEKGEEMEEEGETEGEEKKYISDDFEKVAESNIGSKLLRLMGWSGSGGLGKAGQGIAEPVPITGRLDKKRTGLGQDLQGRPRRPRQGPHQVLTGEDGESAMGLSVNRQDGLKGESFKAWARELLLEYLHSPNLLWFEDLIFASSFTKEERAVIHDTVQRVKELRLALLAKSYGKNQARQLIVTRKAAKDGRTILSDLILCGDNPKFSLLVPPSYYTWLAQQHVEQH